MGLCIGYPNPSVARVKTGLLAPTDRSLTIVQLTTAQKTGLLVPKDRSPSLTGLVSYYLPRQDQSPINSLKRPVSWPQKTGLLLWFHETGLLAPKYIYYSPIKTSLLARKDRSPTIVQ